MKARTTGMGPTEDEAVTEWIVAFREKRTNASDQDMLVQYIRDTLAVSKKNAW